MNGRGEGGYGRLALICAVIGTVIGSGIFFKSEEILNMTNGNALVGLLALAAGGGVMLICASAFASITGELGTRDGIPGYAEKAWCRGFARFAAIFSANFYLPSMTATLALVSGRYFCALIGLGDDLAAEVAAAGLFLIGAFALNTLNPRGAGRLQIVSTAVKLLPLLAVGTMGLATAAGGGGELFVGMGTGLEGFMPALLSATFAYEGWIAVTSLGGREGDGRGIPFALFFGSIGVLFIYLLYYLGVISFSGGESGQAFQQVFGAAGGRIMLGFVTVSCLGALNGITMSTSGGYYILSRYLGRGERGGSLFGARLGSEALPMASGMMGLLISELWLVLCVLSEGRLIGMEIDFSEAAISVMYAIYLPIFASAVLKRRGLGRVLPAAALALSIPVALAAFSAFGFSMVIYLIALCAVSIAVTAIYRR